MHIESIKAQALCLQIKQIFGDNLLTKTVGCFFSILISDIYLENSHIINLIVFMFFIDLALGVAKAIKNRNFSSQSFFKGGIKLIVYGILIATAYSIDIVLHSQDLFLESIFAFLVITDSISVLENLQALGFEVPLFFMKYLKKAKDSLDESLNIK